MNQPMYDVEVTGVETIYGFEDTAILLVFDHDPSYEDVEVIVSAIYDDVRHLYYNTSVTYF